jgi:hypothetical protein
MLTREGERIIGLTLTAETIISSWKERVGSEAAVSSSAPSTQALAEDDAFMSPVSDDVVRNPGAIQALAPVARNEAYAPDIRITTAQSVSHMVFNPPWDSTMPPWLRYLMERKQLTDTIIYMAQPEWSASTRELSPRIFQVTKPRSGTPGHRGVTVSAPRPTHSCIRR